ncbi:hypothetical protein ACFC5Z_12780 [Streptomyces sp. NPDC056004]|uniref:hypothetical protein n=1 Tax=Streptomyces sp. NPDC056004 TaxID=3345677 RepID=UPI0035E168AD
MTTESELSGVDLACQALLAAREAARKNGATSKKPKQRTRTVVGRGGREPLGMGAAIGMMMTERGMVAPAAASRVQAVGLDADSGRLDVVPDAPACGTKLRWSVPQLITAANETVLGANVRAREGGPTAAATTPAGYLPRRHRGVRPRASGRPAAAGRVRVRPPRRALGCGTHGRHCRHQRSGARHGPPGRPGCARGRHHMGSGPSADRAGPLLCLAFCAESAPLPAVAQLATGARITIWRVSAPTLRMT